MHLNNAFRIIKEVQKKFKQYENEKKEMEDVIEQETLKITQTKGNCHLSCKLTTVIIAHVHAERAYIIDSLTLLVIAYLSTFYVIENEEIWVRIPLISDLFSLLKKAPALFQQGLETHCVHVKCDSARDLTFLHVTLLFST